MIHKYHVWEAFGKGARVLIQKTEDPRMQNCVWNICTIVNFINSTHLFWNHLSHLLITAHTGGRGKAHLEIICNSWYLHNNSCAGLRMQSYSVFIFRRKSVENTEKIWSNAEAFVGFWGRFTQLHFLFISFGANLYRSDEM